MPREEEVVLIFLLVLIYFGGRSVCVLTDLGSHVGLLWSQAEVPPFSYLCDLFT